MNEEGIILGSSNGESSSPSNIIQVTPFRFHRGGRTWTDAEIQFLQANYQTLNNEVIAQYLGRSTYAVRKRAEKLNLRKARHKWTAADKQFLKENFASLSYDELSRHLNRSYAAIKAMARKCQLQRNWSGNLELPRREWTREDIEFLKKNYTTLSIVELATHLKRSQWSIYIKASEVDAPAKRREWTTTEIEYLTANYPTSSIGELAQRVNRAERAVRDKLCTLDLLTKEEEWTEEDITFIRTHFGKLSVRELSKQVHQPEAAIQDKLRQLFPIAVRPLLFNKLLQQQVQEFTIAGETTHVIHQVRQQAVSIGKAFCQHPRFKYMRLSSYRLMLKAVIAEAYRVVTKNEVIPFEEAWDQIRQRRYVLRRIIYQS